MKIRVFLSLIVIFAFASFTSAQYKQPMTVKDLWAMKRIGTFDVSPDGSKIVFEATKYSLEKNKGDADIYLINSDGTNLHP